MKDFDELKKLWQQPMAGPPKLDVGALKRTNKSHQRKLERTQLVSSIALLLTGVLIVFMVFGLGMPFTSWLTYAGVVLMVACCLIQGGINLSIYSRLHRMDVTAPAAIHLQQWEAYFHFRERLIRINGPLYMILLNVAFALYFVEVLSLLAVPQRILVGTLYTAWMLFAYFILGKRTLRKERKRLGEIITNLRSLQGQLSADEAPEQK